MTLKFTAIVIDDDGKQILNEETSFAGNKSGLVHAVKAMGDALTYSISLGLFQAKEIPIKDALGNVRTIAKDVLDRKEEKKS